LASTTDFSVSCNSFCFLTTAFSNGVFGAGSSMDSASFFTEATSASFYSSAVGNSRPASVLAMSAAFLAADAA